ncbi:MAG: serine protease [Acidimicrobiia bacterium]|nr:serine protease [Acidimicrobiia bacterium]
MTKWIDLEGGQFERLERTIVNLFDISGLSRLLRYRLDIQLGNIVADAGKHQMVFDLIDTARREAWLDDLLLAVSEARKNHPELEALKTELGIGKSVTPSEGAALEAFVGGVGGLVDPAAFRSKLAIAEATVCHISYQRPDGARYGGTGFLVGPDLIMTNHHVMKYVINEQVATNAVTVKFDYKVDAEGNELNTGTTYRPADEWLVDCSPPADTDIQEIPVVPEAPADQLDYTLFRLADPVGCSPVPTHVPGRSGGVAAGDLQRGWLRVPPTPPMVAQGTPLLILQHPNIGMMKMAWDPAGVTQVNESSTRLRHKTATLPGSSGAPCFNADLDLIALHHAGDPAETPSRPAEYNQAIPISAIASLLATRQLASVLAETCGH